jgi:hypothetical protein
MPATSARYRDAKMRITRPSQGVRRPDTAAAPCARQQRLQFVGDAARGARHRSARPGESRAVVREGACELATRGWTNIQLIDDAPSAASNDDRQSSPAARNAAGNRRCRSSVRVVSW